MVCANAYTIIVCCQFISCIPVNYITMAVEDDFTGSAAAEQEGSNFRAFKVLRLFRLSKMLRLARIKRILAKCTCSDISTIPLYTCV